MKLDDVLHKSTDCLASISMESLLAAPASLAHTTSQPNLAAVGLQDPVSGADHCGMSPHRRNWPDNVDQTSQDVARPVDTSDPRGKYPSRRQPANNRGTADQVAKVSKEDGSSRERTAPDVTSELEKIQAKVIKSLKTFDEMEQNVDTAESASGTKNSQVEKSPTSLSMTVPIAIKSPLTREDRRDDLSSFASFSLGKKKSSTLPKSGGEETLPKDPVDSQTVAAESSVVDTLVEGQQRLSSRSSLTRSDSAPQRKEGSAAFPSNVGHSRFEASSRAIPAATPVVPSGAPAVPPKPSAARKPLTGSVKLSRPSNDGNAGAAAGKLRKK